MRVPGGASSLAGRLDELTDQAKGLGAKGLAWFRVTADGLDSPLAKFLNETESAAIDRHVDGAQVGDIVFCVADEYAERLSRPRRLRVDAGFAAGGRGTAPLRLGHRVPAVRGRRRGRQPHGGAPSLHDAAPRRPGPDRDRPAEGALAGLRPGAQRLGARQRIGANPPRRHPVAGLSGARDLRRGGREPLRLPARRL
jgi:hypothetical protein